MNADPDFQFFYLFFPVCRIPASHPELFADPENIQALFFGAVEQFCEVFLPEPAALLFDFVRMTVRILFLAFQNRSLNRIGEGYPIPSYLCFSVDFFDLQGIAFLGVGMQNNFFPCRSTSTLNSLDSIPFK